MYNMNNLVNLKKFTKKERIINQHIMHLMKEQMGTGPENPIMNIREAKEKQTGLMRLELAAEAAAEGMIRALKE